MSEPKDKKKSEAKVSSKENRGKEKPDAEEETGVTQLDARFRDEIAAQPGGENILQCFACGTCAASCPVTDVDSEYNCRRIIRQIVFGKREEVLSSTLIWKCLVCYRCYVRCPQKVNFTDIMRVLRYLAVKEKRVSPETFDKINELDRFSQELRSNLVNSLFENTDSSLEELEAGIRKAMKGAITKQE